MADYSDYHDYTPRPPRTEALPSLEEQEIHRRVDTHDKFMLDEGSEIQYALDYDVRNEKTLLKFDPPDAAYAPMRHIRVPFDWETEAETVKNLEQYHSYRHRSKRPGKIYKRIVSYGPWIEIDEIDRK